MEDLAEEDDQDSDILEIENFLIVKIKEKNY